jgi:hypothetical protein
MNKNLGTRNVVEGAIEASKLWQGTWYAFANQDDRNIRKWDDVDENRSDSRPARK